MLPRIQSTYFNWSTWRAGSITELGIRCRYAHIIDNAHVLRKYAIGYCDGSSTLCRQKIGRVAVMFRKDGVVFWNHITTREFKEVFKEKL